MHCVLKNVLREERLRKMRIFVILTQRHYQTVRRFMRSEVSTNRQKCESFNHFRTHSIYSERVFTIVTGYINLVITVCVKALVTLNTAPKSVTKGDRIVRNLFYSWVSVYLLVSYFISVTKLAGIA